MRRSGTGSGGGIGMNKNVQPSVRTGSSPAFPHASQQLLQLRHVGRDATHLIFREQLERIGTWKQKFARCAVNL